MWINFASEHNRGSSTKSIKFERRQDPLRTPDDKLVWNEELIGTIKWASEWVSFSGRLLERERTNKRERKNRDHEERPSHRQGDDFQSGWSGFHGSRQRIGGPDHPAEAAETAALGVGAHDIRRRAACHPAIGQEWPAAGGNHRPNGTAGQRFLQEGPKNPRTISSRRVVHQLDGQRANVLLPVDVFHRHDAASD